MPEITHCNNRRVMISPSRTWIVNEESVLKKVEDGSTTSFVEQCENIDKLYPPIA